MNFSFSLPGKHCSELDITILSELFSILILEIFSDFMPNQRLPRPRGKSLRRSAKVTENFYCMAACTFTNSLLFHLPWPKIPSLTSRINQTFLTLFISVRLSPLFGCFQHFFYRSIPDCFSMQEILSCGDSRFWLSGERITKGKMSFSLPVVAHWYGADPVIMLQDILRMGSGVFFCVLYFNHQFLWTKPKTWLQIIA